jgi:N-acetylglucosaminyldiphosphoundecaprenol N-acetyl-beta-D-mannosaminyltransferase
MLPNEQQNRNRAIHADAPREATVKAHSAAICVAQNHPPLEYTRSAGRRRLAFGLAFSNLDAEGVCARMMDRRLNGAVGLVVTPNLNHVRLLRQRPGFAEACGTANIVCADGFPVAAYARLRGIVSGPRVTGCDIFHVLAESAPEHRRKVLVVAESAETQVALQAWVGARELNLCWQSIVAPKNLLGDSAGQSALLASIVAIQPDIVVMTLGAPVSEIFIHRHRAKLPPCWVLCCGQAVRVELGLNSRAPTVVRRLNLEWAWRLAQEPRRLGSRYMLDALTFPRAIMADLRASVADRRIDSGPNVQFADHTST